MKKILGELPDVIKISRPIRWILSGFIFALGFLLSQKAINFNFFLGLIYFLLPFNLLVFGLNDYFDVEADIKNPRKKKIAHDYKSVHFNRHLLDWIALLNFPFFIYFFIIGNFWAKTILVSLFFVTFAYNYKLLRFKAVPLIDTIFSASKYVMIFVLALCLAGSNKLFIPICVSIFFWAAASHIFGSVQDLLADQAMKIRTTAVSLGAKNATLASLTMFSLATIVPAIFYWPVGIVVSLIMSVYILNTGFFVKYKSDAQPKKFERGWNNLIWLDVIVIVFVSTYLMLINNGFRLDSINLISQFYLYIFCIQFLLIIYNLYNLKKPTLKSRDTDWPKISIIVHSLNDGEHIASTLLSLLGQHYPDFEIIFSDLGSKDNTMSIVENYQDPRLKIISTKPREKFWRLNTWANQQLIKKAQADLVIILSADTVLLPDSLAHIASLMKDNTDVFSIMPADQNRTFSQKFILSQNRYFLLGCFPAAYLNKERDDFALATSSLLAFKKSRTKIFDNFANIKRSPLSNVDFCSQAKKHRLNTAFYLGSNLATSHNNASLGDIFLHNYQNFYPALKFNMPLTIFLLICGFFCFCLPVGILISQLAVFNVINISLICIAMMIALINHIIIAVNGKQSLIATLFFPLTSLLSLILIFLSMLNYELLKPRWQNRTEIHTI